MTALPPVAVIGPGRLGSTLAVALLDAGFELSGLATRSPQPGATIAAAGGRTIPLTTDTQDLVDRAGLVFLCVRDAQVEPLCSRLNWRPGQVVVHCSGALSLDALAPAANQGARVGCLHPLQSFPLGSPQPERFRGITCGIDGDDAVLAALSAIAQRLGARVVSLRGVDRAAYHAAAVFASNYAVALMSFAARAWTLAGLPADVARESLAPLLRGASASIEAMNLPDALTGPVARGDAATVAAHLAALLPDPALLAAYRTLALELLRVADIADPQARERLRALLAAPPQR